MIGDIKIMSGTCYFKANQTGTLIKLGKLPWYKELWLQVRDFFKKWEQSEAVEFAKKCQHPWWCL